MSPVTSIDICRCSSRVGIDDGPLAACYAPRQQQDSCDIEVWQCAQRLWWVGGEILIKYPIVGQLMIEATIYMTHNHWDWGVREYFQMNMWQKQFKYNYNLFAFVLQCKYIFYLDYCKDALNVSWKISQFAPEKSN